MNRKNLTAAVLAGLAGAAGIATTAQAVNLNPDGLGQVLLYPYYTSNDGNDTLLSVVNTTDQAKAVKVRFKEGFNSREVLDFNMYMSAYDVWVAAISDDAGTPTLYIPDSTCTVPYLYGDGVAAGLGMGVQPFLPFGYTGTGENAPDGGPSDISRAAEGHFEMLEMGTLVNDDTETAKRIGSAQAATHILNEDGVPEPEDCYQLVDNWTDFASGPDGMWLADHTLDIRRNSGGLFGGAAIINVGRGTMYSYNARAIAGYDKSVDGTHFAPGGSNPSLNDGDQRTAVIFFGVPHERAIEVTYPRPIDAVSGIFMHEYIMNEYNIEAGLNAASEWIVTFPTKNYYVDDELVDVFTPDVWVPDQDDPGCGGWQQGEPFPSRDGPFFTDSVDQSDDNSNGVPDTQEDWVLCTYENIGEQLDRRPFTSSFNGEACERFNLEVWDREESVTTTSDRPPIVSPAPPGGPGEAPFEMCYEVNVLRFGDVSIFGTESDLLLEISDTPDNGWARIRFPRLKDAGGDFIEGYHHDWAGLVGLPVTGFWALQFENGFLGTPEASVLANYGGLFDHKGSVRRTRPDRVAD